LEDTVCLELIRRKDGSIVSISKISEVIVSNCSSLMLWNLVIQQQFWMKECDIFRGGSNHTLTPPTYFQGLRTPQPPESTPLVSATFAAALCPMSLSMARNWLQGAFAFFVVSFLAQNYWCTEVIRSSSLCICLSAIIRITEKVVKTFSGWTSYRTKTKRLNLQQTNLQICIWIQGDVHTAMTYRYIM